MSEVVYSQFADRLKTVLLAREQEEARKNHFLETCELLASFGDHEAKALTLLTLWKAGIYLTSRPMHNSLMTKQGRNRKWVPGHGVPFRYCAESMEPMGAVVEGSVPKSSGTGLARAYRISEVGIELGVPVAGLILDWSLRYPDISVQEILGATNSNSDSRAPETRTNLFLDLLTNPHSQEGVAQAEIKGVTPVKYELVDSAVDRLAELGLIVKESSIELNDRQYSVISNHYQGNRNLGFKSQVFYEFLATKEPGDTFTHQELIEYMTKAFKGLGIEQDPIEIKQWLSTVLWERSPTLKEVKNLKAYNRGYKTRIKVAEQHEDALTDFFEMLLAVEAGDPVILEKGRELAEKIITNPDDVSTLMGKARDFSPKTRTDRKRTVAAITAIVTSAEKPMNIDDIADHYNNQSGHPTLSRDRIGRYLQELAESGQLVVEKARKIDTRKRTVNHYKIPT